MARVTARLNDRQIKAAKPRDKDYVLSDGDGLQLRIRANGSMSWNFNYYHPISKKRINMGLGTYPDVSLAAARKSATEARETLAQGIDPKSDRDQKSRVAKDENDNTFEIVATHWFELKKHTVSEDYAKDIWSSFELHILHRLGQMPISQISAPFVISLLKPIESKGNLETVKRLAQRLNEVMTYAVNSGLIFSNPLSGIRATFKSPKKNLLATIKPEELPALMQALAAASIKRVTRCLIEWQLHTMTRPAEAAGTRWNEIDIENKIWTIPAERMKKRKEHLIPLTDQTLALLQTLAPISGHREYVFPSDRNPRTHSNSQTANMALKRMGYGGKLVSHGLRSLASTILNTHGFDPDLIETALSHVDSNEVRAAYNRSDYLERRRPMMAWWSEHIQKASMGSLSVAGLQHLCN